jgi:hypothetical protein
VKPLLSLKRRELYFKTHEGPGKSKKLVMTNIYYAGEGEQ